MARYGMVIDLKRCYGCYSCVMACKQANCTPPGVFWSRVLRGEMGAFPNSVRQALPVLCMQCEEPDCMKVCPTGATYQTDDGIVRVDKDKCIGCKYCMMACPYDARFVNEEKKAVDKCTFCVHRLDAGLPPACVETCIGHARHYGDINDPNSDVSRLLARYPSYRLYEEAGTEPAIYYIYSNRVIE